MGRFRWLGVFIAAIGVFVPETSYAQNFGCGKRERTFEFSGVNCLGGDCSEINQRVQIFRNKALWSYDLNPTGIVFKLGVTIDLFTDPDNDNTLPPAPKSVRRQTASATAFDLGHEVSLLIHREAINKKGKVISNYYHEIRLREMICGRCEIVTWRMFGDVRGSKIASDFRPLACRVRRG